MTAGIKADLQSAVRVLDAVKVAPGCYAFNHRVSAADNWFVVAERDLTKWWGWVIKHSPQRYVVEMQQLENVSQGMPSWWTPQAQEVWKVSGPRVKHQRYYAIDDKPAATTGTISRITASLKDGSEVVLPDIDLRNREKGVTMDNVTDPQLARALRFLKAVQVAPERYAYHDGPSLGWFVVDRDGAINVSDGRQGGLLVSMPDWWSPDKQLTWRSAEEYGPFYSEIAFATLDEAKAYHSEDPDAMVEFEATLITANLESGDEIAYASEVAAPSMTQTAPSSSRPTLNQ